MSIRGALSLRSSVLSASEGLTEHLLPNDEDADDNDSVSSDEESKSMSAKDMVVAAATALLVTGGAAASVAAMVSVSSIAVYIAGGICVLNAPTVAHKQFQISKEKGVRGSISSIRTQINILAVENNFLTRTVDNLQSTLDPLKTLEDELNNIATSQGSNVGELIALMKENESMSSKMKFILRKYIMSDIAKIFITADRSRDLKIHWKDIPIVSLKVRIQLEAKGINLDVENFEAMIREDNNVTTALKFLDENIDSEMSIGFDMAGQASKIMKGKRPNTYYAKEKPSADSKRRARRATLGGMYAPKKTFDEEDSEEDSEAGMPGISVKDAYAKRATWSVASEPIKKPTLFEDEDDSEEEDSQSAVSEITYDFDKDTNPNSSGKSKRLTRRARSSVSDSGSLRDSLIRNSRTTGKNQSIIDAKDLESILDVQNSKYHRRSSM